MRKKNILVRAFNAFVHRVLNISLGKMHYLRLDIDMDKVNDALKDFDLPVKELTFEDFLTADKKVFNENKLSIIKERLVDPYYKAWGIMENGRLVYSTWVSLKKLGLSVNTQEIIMEPEEGLLEDSFCDPVARGRGLHGKMNWYRIKMLHELGKTKVLAIVLDGNTPAFKVQYKCGFKEVGTFFNGYVFGVKVNTLNKSKFDKLPTI